MTRIKKVSEMAAGLRKLLARAKDKLQGTATNIATRLKDTSQRVWRISTSKIVRGKAAISKGLSIVWVLLLLLICTVAVGVLAQLGWLTNLGFGVDHLPVLLSTVATALSAILAILIAVVFVAYESLREVLRGHASSEVFGSETVRNLVTLYLYTISLAIVLLSVTGDNAPSWATTLSYFVVILALVCLLALYPTTKKILTGASISARKINDLTSRITIDSLYELSSNRRSTTPEYLSEYKRQPIFVLSEIGIRSLLSRDRITPKQILISVTNRVLDIVNQFEESDGQQLRVVLNQLLMIYRQIGTKSIELRDEGTSSLLFECYRLIQHRCATTQTQWYATIEWDNVFVELASYAIQNGLQKTAQSAAFTFEAVHVEQLRSNVAPESEIWLLLPKEEMPEDPDHDASNHWSTVTTTYTRALVTMHEAASKAGQVEIARTIRNVLGWLPDKIKRLDNLGTRQKHQMIADAIHYSSSLAIEEARQNRGHTISHIAGLGALSISTSLEEDLPWARQQLVALCRTVSKLVELSSLSPFVLNEIGAIGRGCLDSLSDNSSDARCTNALKVIAATFEELAAKVIKSQSQENSRMIYEIEKQSLSLIRWYNAKQVNAPELLSIIQESSERISDLLQEHSRDSGNLDWPED